MLSSISLGGFARCLRGPFSGDVYSVQKDSKIFLLDLRAILNVGCGLTDGFQVDALYGEILALDIHLYPFHDLRVSWCLLTSEILNLQNLRLRIHLYCYWKVSVDCA